MGILKKVGVHFFLKKVTSSTSFKNSIWLFYDKFSKLFFSFLTTIYIARHLGEELFGELNYALAVCSIFFSISSIGLNSIVRRELLWTESEKYSILATALLLRIITSLILFLVVVLFSYTIFGETSLTFQLIIIISLSLFALPSEVIEYYFNAFGITRKIFYSKSIAFIFVSLIRLLSIVLGGSITWFAWLHFVEYFSSALLLFAIFNHKKNLVKNLKWNRNLAYKLIKSSWPLFLSSAVIVLYMKTDQLMLGYLSINKSPVGEYSAALRLSEVWYFIPIIITSVFFPRLVHDEKRSNEEFLASLQKLYKLMTVIAVLISVITSFTASSIVNLLFKGSFEETSHILTIHIWTSLFVFWGTINTQYVVIKNSTKVVLYRSLVGLFFNITLNYYLIPLYSGIGAALATLVTQIVTATIFNIVHKQFRVLFYLQMRSLNPFRL
ncbi:flippase [Fulvivirga sp. M361]|uniref:flippase n=1 Tax=Fulvivirga sp. M361 TaxID=2594266 RepID=UPI00117BA44C|nr:flippase [Fulvivirga sp. M361]TRX51651.1 flippase [Fulvivirga sp. M361]